MSTSKTLLPVTSRGLLELGLEEHNETLSVKKRLLRDQAIATIYRSGVFTQNSVTNEVSVDAYGI